MEVSTFVPKIPRSQNEVLGTHNPGAIALRGRAGFPLRFSKCQVPFSIVSALRGSGWITRIEPKFKILGQTQARPLRASHTPSPKSLRPQISSPRFRKTIATDLTL
jgi:hypothetical protein